MSAHTPGPWKVIRPENARRQVLPEKIVPSMGGFIATLGIDGIGNRAANANLIAAAPDLLAACEAIARVSVRCRCSVREIESGHHVDCNMPEIEEALGAARAAIAKARAA